MRCGRELCLLACRDGSGTDALLQHPLAVLALRDGTVLVADSYNHRLKVQNRLVHVPTCTFQGPLNYLPFVSNRCWR